jgi:hypothetical protein
MSHKLSHSHRVVEARSSSAAENCGTSDGSSASFGWPVSDGVAEILNRITIPGPCPGRLRNAIAGTTGDEKKGGDC